MKAKKQEGTIIILYETDMDAAKSLDESTLSEIQKMCLSKLSDKERSQVLAGQAASATNLSDGSTICEFNLDTYTPPQHAIESLARRLLPHIKSIMRKKEPKTLNMKKWKGSKKGHDRLIV